MNGLRSEVINPVMRTFHERNDHKQHLFLLSLPPPFHFSPSLTWAPKFQNASSSADIHMDLTPSPFAPPPPAPADAMVAKAPFVHENADE